MGTSNYLLAATISFIAGLLVNYALSKFWVFHDSKLHNQTHEFLFFSLIGLVGLGLNDLIFWILTSGLGLFYIFSNVIATFIVDFWNLVPGKNTYLINRMAKQKIAIIIGAGPAGLTAAYELLHKTNIKPLVFEASNDIGGISKTVNYKGNRIDIGGHRFFSKSDRVIEWWNNILPLQKTKDKFLTIKYHGKSQTIEDNTGGVDPDKADEVMLIRSQVKSDLLSTTIF